jgi:predicted ATPase/DNA-binding SARP family transcriptional activator
VIVHDLGSLLIEVDEREHPPGGNKPAAILAILTINANRRVSVEVILDAVWGDQATEDKTSTLGSHVWRLRRVLEPGRSPGERPRVLINDAAGYRLLLGADELDSARFERLASEGRDLLDADRPARALQRLDEALALWRGRPYTPLSDEQWAEPAVARLDGIHATAQERRIDALLALGRTDEALVDLEPLIGAMPFRERLWAQRMLALFRAGRNEAALQAFRDVRTLLVEEVGLEPGADLRDLHRRILEGDRTLLLQGQDAAAQGRPAAPAPVRVHLPARVTPLIGRADDLARLTELVSAHRLVTVTGVGGCGKTRLSIAVARGLADRFPGGVWFVDLVPVGDSESVLETVITGLGIAVPPTGTPLEALVAYVRSQQMLLVLDNCEHVLAAAAELAEALLAEDSDCAVLATSREPLGVDGEVVWTLRPLALPGAGGPGGPVVAPAVELFVGRLRAADPTVALDADAMRTVERICVGLDGLPLAMELAAARARAYSLDEIEQQVTSDPTGLARIGRPAAPRQQSLGAAMQWSYQLLTAEEQQLHQALSVLPGTFTREVATALLPELDRSQVGDLLAMLVNRSLVGWVRPTRPGGPSAFVQLVTVRAHAAQLLAEAGRTGELADRRDGWVRDLVMSRPARLGRAEVIPWYERVDDDYPTVRAFLHRSLVDRHDPAGSRVATRLLMYWYYRDLTVEAVRWLRLGVDLADRMPPAQAASAHLAQLMAVTYQGRADLGRPNLDRALALLPKVPEAALPDLGDLFATTATAAAGTEEYELSRTLSEQASAIAGRTGDPDIGVLCDAVECIAAASAGDLGRVAADAEAVYARAVDRQHLFAAWVACAARSAVAVARREPEVGLLWSDRLFEIHGRFGRRQVGPHVEVRAHFYAMSGRWPSAVRLYSAARSHSRRMAIRWPRNAITPSMLAQAERELTRDEFDRAWREGERLMLADVVAERTG